jgi:hypothetical protein
MSWLRRISYEFRYDERIGQFIPDDAPQSEREKLKRSQYSSPKLGGKKRKASDSEQTQSEEKKKAKAKATAPPSEDSEESEASEDLDGFAEAKETPNAKEGKAVNEVEGAEKDVTKYAKEDAEEDAQKDAKVFFCFLCDTVVELVNADPAPAPTSDAILRAQLIEMLMKAREWESYEQTRKRELRWHREMIWVKFQIPGHKRWAPID